MVFSLRKWLERAQFVFLFLVLTILLHQGLQYISVWFSPEYKYNEPSGESVKAFGTSSNSSWQWSEKETFKDRLKFFYWYGE